ncbi:ubiquitin carboxyl-terminal hydrolase [mine drainage metagenome]|uniref:Ubiquitin carboxyl-terminal hydrolase n=1 Tax=mine drainage metagenome TaxID=410659 RepID=A0A1J5QGM2_9ZZZZ
MTPSATAANYRRKVRTLFASLSTVLLAACGGGDGEDTTGRRVSESATSRQATTGKVHGLRNHTNTCAIGSVVQLLMHDEPLRKQAQRSNPELHLDLLRDAYHGNSNAADELDAVYAANVLHPIQARYAKRAAPGSLIEAADLWSHADGLQLPLYFVADPPREIPLQRREHGERVFGFLAEGSGDGSGYVNFADLPERDQLRGLVYNAGGHYVAYVRVDGRWWLFNDSQAIAIDELRMHRLRANEGCGVAFVVYET